MTESELLAHVSPVESYTAEDCRHLVAEAQTYLAGFQWARPGKMCVGECIPGVIAIFFVELHASGLDVDRFIWVIVGDLPPAYLSPVYCGSPRAALQGYMEEMSAWVDAVQKGESTDDFIPVNAEPTKENATALSTRLRFLEWEILPR